MIGLLPICLWFRFSTASVAVIASSERAVKYKGRRTAVLLAANGDADHPNKVESRRHTPKVLKVVLSFTLVGLLVAFLKMPFVKITLERWGQSLLQLFNKSLFMFTQGSNTVPNDNPDENQSVYLPQTEYVASVLDQMQSEGDTGIPCCNALQACQSTGADTDEIQYCVQRICEHDMYRNCKSESVLSCESMLFHYYDLQIFETCKSNDASCINAFILKCNAEILEKCYPEMYASKCSRDVMSLVSAQLSELE